MSENPDSPADRIAPKQGRAQLAATPRDIAILIAILSVGYVALESGSLWRGMAPRPVALQYGYEPWNSQPPPTELPEASPILFDEILQFLPWQELTRRELEAGRVPLWNPYQYCGAPHLAASQPAVFSPFSILALPRSVAAQHISRLAGFLVAGVGAQLWLAALGVSAAACILGAGCFAFCGFLTLWAGHPHFLSAVWLPWLLLGVERLKENGSVDAFPRIQGSWRSVRAARGRSRRSPAVPEDPTQAGTPDSPVSSAAAEGGGVGDRNGVRSVVDDMGRVDRGTGCGSSFRGILIVAVSMAFSLLGGHVETSFHLALVAGIYGLLRAPSSLPRLALGGIVGVGLAAVTLLPFLEYLLESSALASRHDGFELSRALPWQAIGSLLIPGFSGGWPFGTYLLDRANLNEVAGAYCGPVVLALALSSRGSELARPLVWTMLVCLLLAFEPWPVGSIAEHLPVLALAYNGRLLLVVALMLCGLGAAGFDAVLAGRSRPELGVAVVATMVLILGWVGRTHVPLASVLVPLGCLVLALVLLKVFEARGSLILAAVAIAPGIWLGQGYHGAGPTGWWPELEVKVPESLASARFAGFGRQAFPAELATAYGLRDVRGYDAMTPRRYDEVLSKLEPLARQGGRLGIFRLRALTAWAGPLYDFLGVGLVYVGRAESAGLSPGGTSPSALPPDFRALGRGYWYREAKARARFVRAPRFFPDEASVLAYVTSPEFDPDRPGLQEPARLSSGQERDGDPSATPADPSTEAVAKIRFLQDEPMSVAIDTESAEPGYVVLADTDFPGWQVYVDGRPGKSLRANHSFRAVAVSAGKHQVRWIYRPESFLIGVFVSSIFLGLMVICGALNLVGRRRLSC